MKVLDMKHMMTAVILTVMAQPAFAVDVPESMTNYAIEQMGLVAANTAIIAAIHAQNQSTGALSEAEILTLDQAWRAETGAAERPMIDATLSNPVSAILAGLAAASDGRITEAFIMDARGLNVGQSAVTSDYWQGDEEKFSETYPKGANAIHVSEIELDQSTQTYQGQVSISITDPTTGDTIGAVTFGIDASSFF